MKLWNMFVMGLVFAVTGALAKVFIKRMLAESPPGSLAAELRENV